MNVLYVQAWDAGTHFKMHGFFYFFLSLPLYTQNRSTETLRRQINNGGERRVL